MRIFVLLLVLVSCTHGPAKKRTDDKLSILQGVTNSASVEFSILAPKEKNLRIELRTADGEITLPDEVRIIAKDFTPYAIHKVFFTRDPQKVFNIFIFEGERLLDQRLVGRGQTQRDRLRLAVVSCSDDYYEKSFGIWNALAAKNPDYLLLIGDNVYVDKKALLGTQEVTPEVIWNRYIDVRLSLPLFYQEKLIPIHAIWDDHDFGLNDAGENFPHKEASKEVFEAFYAQQISEDDWTKGPGVSGLLSLGDFNLYFLDGRSFRSSHPEGKHLGIDQESWLLKKLAEENTPSFLIKGDQFFGGYHRFESFEGNHPQNFASFTGELKKLKTPVVFVSGDRHLSEIMQFPRSIFAKPGFEITSSPIHATMFPGSEVVNPWRVVMNDNKFNFTIINNEALENHWFMEVENIGEAGQSIYRRELTVFIKDLQNNLQETRKRRHGKRRYRRFKRSRRRR